MNLPFVASLPSNLGIFSLLRRNLLLIFLVIWFVIVAGVMVYVFFDIRARLNAPLPDQRAQEFKVDPVDTSLFSSKSFLNLRTMATSPGQSEYKQCLGVPGRPHIFTPFVPCQ